MKRLIVVFFALCFVNIHAGNPYACSGPNMESVSCPNPGKPSCSNPLEPRVLGDCKSLGCQCKDGYIWNNKMCVRPSKCPKPVCKANEVYSSCKNPCEDTCKTINSSIKIACLPAFPCPGGCNCKPDFVRNEDGVCIPKSECPPALVCKANEVLNECPGPCVPGEISYCSEYVSNTPLECDPPAELPCEPRCDCIAGYLRNKDGICVKQEDCCEDTNAIAVDCPNPCPRTCDNPTGPKVCSRACVTRGCTCRDGFVLNEANGKCILPELCPLKCKENEKLNPCAGYCTFDEDCGSYIQGFIRDCAAPPEDFQCGPRCDCVEGLIRVDDGTCQLPDKCCNDPNAEVVPCPAPCEETCSIKPAADCKEECFARRCRCKAGFVKDANDKCIPRNKCPRKCGLNEKFNECAGYCTFDETCASYIGGLRRACAAPPPFWECGSRCECLKGYVRINDVCQLPNLCCDDANAEVVSCPAPCEETCSFKPAADCKEECPERKCACKPGYVKDNNTKKCIPRNKCPVVKTCKGQNEEYLECGTACQATCKKRNPMCKAKCGPGCFCKKGFIRERDGGRCIKPVLCPY